MSNRILVFDSTLRDGAQMEGVTFTLEDKKDIIKRLDDLGVDFIEGGMPQANVTDRQLFSSGIVTKHASLVAFGSTHRPGVAPEDDSALSVLADSDCEWVCIFGKAWKLHINDVLHISPEENLEIVMESVSFLKSKGKRIIFDAEHFFDGYKEDGRYAMSVIKAAERAGAEWLTLCDTNGGTLPEEVASVVKEAVASSDANIAIHCHNDSDLAVANTLVAVRNGAKMVQVTMNGMGERCGNANLCSVVPDLRFKLGFNVNIDVSKLTTASYAVCDIANTWHNASMPYVGSRAFTHKGGMHIDALLKNPHTYEHISPESVGNHRNVLVSEQSGRAGIINKLKEFGLDTSDSQKTARILDRIKTMESEGYQFEACDASLELLMRRELNELSAPFVITAFRIYIDEIGHDEIKSEASIKVKDMKGNMEHTASDGDGPVDAMNNALKKGLSKFFPIVDKIRLTDYKVRVLDEKAATAAAVRVMIRSTDGVNQWTTVGVSTNVIEASLIALIDSMEYAVLKNY